MILQCSLLESNRKEAKIGWSSKKKKKKWVSRSRDLPFYFRLFSRSFLQLAWYWFA